ncbi:DUF3299 domain-containing protein [Ruegeria sp.]|uniref:DUF3299 domain-containing protein n=1 Tax=Ruegeria sp. TaxID=1879320 RepID=UPI003C7EB120
MRKSVLVLTVLALACVCPVAVLAGLKIDWSNLPDPSAQTFEDPYRDLSAEQLDDVLFVIRLRGRLQQSHGSEKERQKWHALLNATEEALATDKIDVDWLLSQRETVIERRTLAGTEGNPKYDGQTITIAGFAIPAPPDADGQSVAYLVPEPGMCSHMPPPPPNQMIRVRLQNHWTPSYFHEPVRLTGVLSIDPSDHRMMVIDGVVPMHATFLLEASTVEALETDGDQLEWNESIVNRFHAADRRKTGGSASSD